jgi:hypothetical protein
VDHVPLELIAERKLELQEPSGATRPVVVRIGKPVFVARDGGHWNTPYEIDGLESAGHLYASSAFGEDAVQALVLALEKIGAELAFYAQRHGTLSWLGLPGDHGFPRAQTEP